MKLRNVEDAYPLSPLQQGILFHSLYSPASGEYLMQLVYTLRGYLDAAALADAWQRVVNRHPILRTAFVWEGLDEHLQVVRGQVTLAWEELDWRGQSPAEQEERLATFLKADKRKGFDLIRAPLMRCTLLRFTEDTYKFVWTYHHLLIDGWCLALVMKDISIFYDANCRGESVEPPLPRPYKDYIAWLQGRDLSRAEAFWRRRLKGYTAPARLSVEPMGEESRAEEADEHGRRLQVSTATTEALQTLARRHQMTMYNIVQAAWALLLSRYSGEDDVVFGVTVSGRPAELTGAESMVGLFINTLPARVKIQTDASLLHWLKNLQVEQLEMLEYQYSPLVRVQRWSEVPPATSLFESILIFENYVAEDLAGQVIGGMEIVDSYVLEKNNYALTISVRPGANLSLRILYDPARFSRDAVDRILTHLETLLENIAANPQQRVAELSMLPERERRQLLDGWNETHADYEETRGVVRLFEEQAALTPDSVAVTDGREQLTYSQLNRKANQLAHYLRASGVGPESLVGVCVERSVGMLIALLGILKSGGAYVPLDPSYPSSRLAFIIEDAAIEMFVTERQFAAPLAIQHARHVCLDSDWETIAHYDDQDPPIVATPDNLAYVIYTSGSTGVPKGVQIQHRALANFLHAMLARPGLKAEDKLLSVTTLSFDIAALELYLPLTVGACVSIASREVAGDGELLAREIANSVATVMQATPATWRLLLDSGWTGDERLKVLCGGEALPGELAGRLLGSVGSLWNLYGPTETTIWSAAHKVERESNPVPIGRPVANTPIYILDASMQPAPVGIPGELYIGGDGLARGYLHRPDLTAEKFIPQPFGDTAGARLYRTGDVARYLPDGCIEYLGRTDQQVKVRGFRIELGEIEAVMREHGDVRECVALAREDVPGNKRLVGYVVPAAQRARHTQSSLAGGEDERLPASPLQLAPPDGLVAADGDSAALEGGTHREIFADDIQLKDGGDAAFDFGPLRQFLETKLPAYMIPSAFVEINELPLTPNGKVDRRALPAPGGRRPTMGVAYVAPRTPTEEAVAGIYAKTLGLERIGAHDNFFEGGGHSLLATQVLTRVREVLGVDITLRNIFDHATVEKLSVLIEQAKVSAPQPLTPAIVRVSRDAFRVKRSALEGSGAAAKP